MLGELGIEDLAIIVVCPLILLACIAILTRKTNPTLKMARSSRKGSLVTSVLRHRDFPALVRYLSTAPDRFERIHQELDAIFRQEPPSLIRRDIKLLADSLLSPLFAALAATKNRQAYPVFADATRCYIHLGDEDGLLKNAEAVRKSHYDEDHKTSMIRFVTESVKKRQMKSQNPATQTRERTAAGEDPPKVRIVGSATQPSVDHPPPVSFAAGAQYRNPTPDQTRTIRFQRIDVNGVGVVQNINACEPIALSVNGINVLATVLEGTDVISIELNGINNVVRLPQNLRTRIAQSGINNRIVYY